MILSFPNMGPNWVAFKTLFEQLDPSIKVILPDPTNREAIKVGVKYSPEFVCFPFKATLGDFVNVIKKGADTLVMAIDCGPCRFGFYHAVQERLLHDMGYKHVTIIPLDQADLLEFHWVKTLQEVSGKSGLFAYPRFVKGVIFFLKKAASSTKVSYSPPSPTMERPYFLFNSANMATSCLSTRFPSHFTVKP